MTSTLVGERTQGSKTFQYLEEKKPIGIFLVAASEKKEAQTVLHSLCMCKRIQGLTGGVVR